MASVDRVQYYSLVILTAIAITGALSYTKPVLVPFAFSLLLFGLISPAMFYIQEKFSFPRWLAIFTVFTSILVCFAGLMILIINSFGEFLKGADTYKALIVQTIENGQDFAARLGFQLNADELANEIKSLPLLRYLQGFSGGLFFHPWKQCSYLGFLAVLAARSRQQARVRDDAGDPDQGVEIFVNKDAGVLGHGGVGVGCARCLRCRSSVFIRRTDVLVKFHS